MKKACHMYGRLLAVSLFSLLSFGCATLGSMGSSVDVNYDALLQEGFDKRPEARATELSESALIDSGYLKLGRLKVTYIVEDDGRQISHNIPLNGLVFREAADRGGDLVRIEKDNEAASRTLYKSGRCLRYQRVLQQTTTRGGRLVTYPTFEYVNQCVQNEQIPYLKTTTMTSGTVWRHEPELVKRDKEFTAALVKSKKAELERIVMHHPSLEKPLLNGKTPLRTAIDAGNAAAVRLLLEKGVKPVPADLQAAADTGHGAIADLLIAQGLATGGVGEDVQDELWSASLLGRSRVVKALLAKGANVNALDKKDGMNALHKTAWACRLETFKLLLAHGADPEATTKQGERAIDLAASSAEWSKRAPAEREACRQIMSLLQR